MLSRLREKTLDALGHVTTWAWDKLVERLIPRGTWIVGPSDEYEKPAR